MTTKWSLILFGCAVALCACEEQKLSIGELRCEGEGVVCEVPAPLGQDWGFAEPEPLPEQEVEVAWIADMPCPGPACYSSAPHAVVHADGSTTVVRLIEVVEAIDDQFRRPLKRGIWLAGFDAQGVFPENSAPRSLAFSKAAGTRKPSRATNWLHLSNMKNLLGSVWRSLIRATYRKHDPFLVYSMASFNSGGGWNEFLLKASLQNT